MNKTFYEVRAGGGVRDQDVAGEREDIRALLEVQRQRDVADPARAESQRRIIAARRQAMGDALRQQGAGPTQFGCARCGETLHRGTLQGDKAVCSCGQAHDLDDVTAASIAATDADVDVEAGDDIVDMALLPVGAADDAPRREGSGDAAAVTALGRPLGRVNCRECGRRTTLHDFNLNLFCPCGRALSVRDVTYTPGGRRELRRRANGGDPI